jgi:hypothetical protein
MNKYRTIGLLLAVIGLAAFAHCSQQSVEWFGTSSRITMAGYVCIITSVIIAGTDFSLLITGAPFSQTVRAWNAIPQWKQLGLSGVVILVSVAILLLVRRLF